MRSLGRPFVVLALCGLTACGAQAAATGDGGGPGNDKLPICHVPPGNPANAHIIHPDDASYDAHLPGSPGGHDTDYFVDAGHPCPPSPPANPTTTTTEKPHQTTTTRKPHETTTTTEKPHETTTTHKPHETTTTHGNTTTTVRHTTTTAGATTTTARATTTTTGGGGTTTTRVTTTTTGGGGTTTTRPPTPGQFSVQAASVCLPNGTAGISITFGNRPDLNGRSGELSIISLPNGLTVSFQPLVFQSGQTVTIPYPPVAAGTTSATLNYNLAGEFATASIGPPLTNCGTTTTTTTGGSTSTTAATTTTGPTTTGTAATTTTVARSTTTAPSATTTTSPGITTTTVAPLALSGAATVCRAEVPTIVITFGNTFPELAGRTGTLTMSDAAGNVVSTQPLVYTPNTTVELLYPGTRVNADGTIADVPGWNLNAAGLWVRDPSDEFLREGILLTYTVNPTATAFITYPPESAACANPDNPVTPGAPGAPPAAPGAPARPPLPPTGNEPWTAALAAVALAAGSVFALLGRRRRS